MLIFRIEDCDGAGIFRSKQLTAELNDLLSEYVDDMGHQLMDVLMRREYDIKLYASYKYLEFVCAFNSFDRFKKVMNLDLMDAAMRSGFRFVVYDVPCWTNFDTHFVLSDDQVFFNPAKCNLVSMTYDIDKYLEFMYEMEANA